MSEASKIGPFSENPIMVGYDNRLFVSDSELGYVFPDNQIVGKSSFVDFSSKANELKKRAGKYLVLNLGDSTTSGWNSDLVYKGCPDPRAALFSYKTYSDVLEEKFGAAVINAGVPGYTSYQAKKQLKQILKKFAQEEIYVDYVTVYLGNNDCTFNGLEDKARIDFQAASTIEVFGRVSAEDFQQNYTEIVHTIKAYGATPIILIPASNYNWQPGLRSQKYPNELEEQREKITNPKIKQLFSEAEKAHQFGDHKLALEKDVLLPRIKKTHKAVLYSFANDCAVIDTQGFIRGEDDFVDYCHTGEPVNEAIAETINSLLLKKNTAYKERIVAQDLPADTYTLY